MTFQAKDVMSQASTTLQDNGAIHWTPPELLSYLNEAVREIVVVKPNAATQTVTMNLVAGPKQSIGATHTILSRAIRNVASNKPIRVLDRRETLDNMIPGWMANSVLAYAADVSYIIHDLTDPRTFYVAPGAIAGTTQIEVVVGVMPAEVPAGSNVLDISTYTGLVGLPDSYRNAIIDYILYRAFSKDAGIAGAAQRATAHKQLFDAALGNVASGENALALSTFANQGSSKPSAG